MTRSSVASRDLSEDESEPSISEPDQNLDIPLTLKVMSAMMTNQKAQGELDLLFGSEQADVIQSDDWDFAGRSSTRTSCV